MTVPEATAVRIEFTDTSGAVTVLKDRIALKAGEVLDGTFMSRGALASFLEAQMEDAKQRGVLFSIHLKATMMKISDPDHLRPRRADVLPRRLRQARGGFQADRRRSRTTAWATCTRRSSACRRTQQAEIEADIQATYAKRPALAMVNSDKGITNLHVPSDVIIDASIPPMIRDSGQMWGTGRQAA